MEDWITILLPFSLLLGRISGFFAVAPIFSWSPIPVRVRASLTLMVTIFFALITPETIPPGGTDVVRVVILISQEIICGLAIGMAARLAYSGVQQGGRIAGRQMGMMLAKVMDPTTGERSQPLGVLFDISFMVLFLAAGGHHMLILLLARSYDVFPIGQTPDIAALTDGIVTAGTIMFLFALKLSAPVLAAFLVLGVALAVMARVLPEMNILVASLPLRVALGLFMAAAILPTLDTFTIELAQWMRQLLIA